jgi:cell division protein FtsB
MSPKLTEKKRRIPVVEPNARWRSLSLALLLLLAAYIALGNSELWEMGEQRRAVDQLQAQVSHLQAERDSLKNVLWRLENDMNYVEKVAREEYGMSKKGERIYPLRSSEDP